MKFQVFQQRPTNDGRQDLLREELVAEFDSAYKAVEYANSQGSDLTNYAVRVKPQ